MLLRNRRRLILFKSYQTVYWKGSNYLSLWNTTDKYFSIKEGSYALGGNYGIRKFSNNTTQLYANVMGTSDSSKLTGGTDAAFRNGWGLGTKSTIDFSKYSKLIIKGTWDSKTTTSHYTNTGVGDYGSDYYRRIIVGIDTEKSFTINAKGSTISGFDKVLKNTTHAKASSGTINYEIDLTDVNITGNLILFVLSKANNYYFKVYFDEIYLILNEE